MGNSRKVLVTDSLFIYREHVSQLEEAGFEVERLDKLSASESELIEALEGKEGYILGGVEKVTEPVIRAVRDSLKVISFTGSGFADFIPAHEYATQNGIAISAAVGGNALAVAEFALTNVLAAIRHSYALTIPGGSSFYVAPAFQDVTLGIVGYGAVGSAVARLAEAVGIHVLCNSRRSDRLSQDGRENVSLEVLLQRSDVVSLHVSEHHGKQVLGERELRLLKHGATIINCAFAGAVDKPALASFLARGELFAIFDNDAYSPSERAAFPIGALTCTNAQSAFNTGRSNKEISDRVTSSLVNLLRGLPDTDLVNPSYSSFRHRE